MGVSGGGSESRKGSPVSLGFRFLTRKKQVDSAAANTSGLLAKELTIPHLIAVGVGATIGAGVYVLVGTVARENAGPALTLSFLIAGIAAGLSAFCYAELASRCPSAGSAYHYSYICLGEGVAWIVGWALILEYTIGSSAVARGVSPNLAALCGGADNLPFFLSRQHIPGIDLIVDPCAAILVFVVTGLLCWGVKESTVIQGVVTTVNVCALLFVVVAGGYLGFKSGWVGYNLPTGYFPFGVNGMLAGSATVFFAYIGFDAVASTAEEVKNPQRDLPLGIAGALFLCCGLYMLVCIVVVGLVPYYLIDPDTPISSAFANNGMQWAGYIINAGAFTALCSALMGGLLPQPRILMAMARDGLLPTFFSDINKRTQVPIKSTIATGIAAAALAFFMDVDAMAGMVSVGTLLAFTMVAVSVLILRYIPPVDVPLSRSLQDSIETVSLRYRLNNAEPSATSSLIKADTSDRTKPLVDKDTVSKDHPPVTAEHFAIGNYMKIGNRRSVAGWAIALTCIGSFVLTFAASNLSLPSFVRYPLCGVGVIVLLCCLVFLSLIEQDDARHNFGYSGGFVCPFVPLLPIACILINFYLLVSLGLSTWLRVSVWLGVGVLVYVFYGRTHSSLKDAIYVPATRVEEIYTNARSTVA